MIDPTAGAAAASGGTTSILGQAGGALGKEEFLQLLVAQLRNQDPMNPMKSDEFAAQLAQFSSVEQLMNINEGMTGQAQVTAALAQAMNSSAAVGVLGRQVLAMGDQVHMAGGRGALEVEVGGVGGDATVRLYDASDHLVGELDVGALEGGRQTIDLNGFSVPDGAYRYEIDVTDAAGDPVSTTNYTHGVVDGVKYGENGPVLLLGDIEIPLSAVFEVSAN